ncbi:MAG TPA: hypothetical protein DD614_02240 [Clostridiales bacterium]|nr:hypothetical protein [Clostridiales bacterium]
MQTKKQAMRLAVFWCTQGLVNMSEAKICRSESACTREERRLPSSKDVKRHLKAERLLSLRVKQKSKPSGLQFFGAP